jgi:predicted dehydrogenase
MVHKFAMAMWLVDQDITSVQAARAAARLLLRARASHCSSTRTRTFSGILDVQYAPKMWMRSSYYGADEFFEIQGDEGMIWVTRATGEMLDLAPGHSLQRQAGQMRDQRDP